MWIAPGMCPSSHSSWRRTSTQTAPSSSWASRASTSSISRLGLFEEFPVGRHGFKNDSSARRHSRYRRPKPCRPRLELVITVAARGRWRLPAPWSRSRSRRGRSPARACTRRRASPRCRQACPARTEPRSAQAFASWPQGKPRHAASGSAQITRRTRSSSSTSGSASSGPATTARPRRRSRRQRKHRPRHAVGDRGRQRPASAVLHRLPGLRADAAERAALAGRRSSRRRVISTPPSGCIYERGASSRPSDDQAQVAAAVGRFDKDNLAASFSQLGPLTQRFPKSQIVRFYLGLLLAWTGAARRRGHAVPASRRARPEHEPRSERRRRSSTGCERVGPAVRRNEPDGPYVRPTRL